LAFCASAGFFPICAIGSEFGVTLLHHLSPILGIAIMKFPAEILKQRTILFKLFLMRANLFRSVSGIEKRTQTTMQSNRSRDFGLDPLQAWKIPYLKRSKSCLSKALQTGY
jgi:hypothetical protein